MNLHHTDLRMFKDKQRDMQRRAEKQRLAREVDRSTTRRRRSTPLWTRLWSLF